MLTEMEMQWKLRDYAKRFNRSVVDKEWGEAHNLYHMILPAAAQENAPFQMYTTAYCHGEITASGTPVRRGICAVKREWMGKTAIVYTCGRDGGIGELLGIYECLDTGFGGDADGDGIGSIEEGKVIDIYFPTLEECRGWMEQTGGKVYVQLVDAKG